MSPLVRPRFLGPRMFALALPLTMLPTLAWGQADVAAKRPIIENRGQAASEPAAVGLPSPTPRKAAASAPAGPRVLGVRLEQKLASDSPNGWVVEWISADETFERWTLLAATRFYRNEPKSPREFAQNLAEQMRKRREEGDHVANAAVFSSEKDDSCVVDFLVSQDGKTFEHNVMRFVRAEGGLICQQIARRAYEDQTDDASSDDRRPATPVRLLWRPANEQGEPVAALIKSIPPLRARLIEDLQKLEITKSPAGR